MKQLILRRALSALLCLALALSLTACGGGTELPETPGGSSMTGALSGGKGNVSEPKDDPDDPEKVEAGLVLLRACWQRMTSWLARWPISVSASQTTARR